MKIEATDSLLNVTTDPSTYKTSLPTSYNHDIFVALSNEGKCTLTCVSVIFIERILGNLRVV
jgi:hypothetical protein